MVRRDFENEQPTQFMMAVVAVTMTRLTYYEKPVCQQNLDRL